MTDKSDIQAQALQAALASLANGRPGPKEAAQLLSIAGPVVLDSFKEGLRGKNAALDGISKELKSIRARLKVMEAQQQLLLKAAAEVLALLEDLHAMKDHAEPKEWVPEPKAEQTRARSGRSKTR